MRRNNRHCTKHGDDYSNSLLLVWSHVLVTAAVESRCSTLLNNNNLTIINFHVCGFVMVGLMKMMMIIIMIIASTHLFCPVAIETAGTWNAMAVELVQEIGRRITVVTQEPTETTFLF